MDKLEHLEMENRVLWNVINETRRVLDDKRDHSTARIKKAMNILTRTGYYIKRSFKEGQTYEFPSRRSRKRFSEEVKMLMGSKDWKIIFADGSEGRSCGTYDGAVDFAEFQKVKHGGRYIIERI